MTEPTRRDQTARKAPETDPPAADAIDTPDAPAGAAGDVQAVEPPAGEAVVVEPDGTLADQPAPTSSDEPDS